RTEVSERTYGSLRHLGRLTAARGLVGELGQRLGRFGGRSPGRPGGPPPPGSTPPLVADLEHHRGRDANDDDDPRRETEIVDEVDDRWTDEERAESDPGRPDRRRDRVRRLIDRPPYAVDPRNPRRSEDDRGHRMAGEHPLAPGHLADPQRTEWARTGQHRTAGLETDHPADDAAGRRGDPRDHDHRR